MELWSSKVTKAETVAATVSVTEAETEASIRRPSTGLIFLSKGDGTCSVNGIASCTDSDIVIPSVSPDGDTVTAIGDGAFQNSTSRTSITIPDTVTHIGKNAFWNCSSLKSITIPSSVTYIGSMAFNECRNLREIKFENPNGWTRTDSKGNKSAVNASELSGNAAGYFTNPIVDLNCTWTRE